MALKFAVETIFSGSIQILLDRLASAEVLEFFRGRKRIEKLLDEFKTPLMLANRVFHDAERKRICDPEVRRWLEDLEHAIYIADDLLDQIKTEVLRRKLEEEESRPAKRIANRARDFIPISLNAFDSEMETKLRDIFDRIRSIVDLRQYLDLSEGVENTTTRRVPPMEMEDSCVYGRDSEKETLVDRLVSSNDDAAKLSVISIVGMGGLGKTTLAQLVFNHEKVKGHFKELRAWVTVSDEFDVFRLTKTIFEIITSKTSDVNDPYRLPELQLSLKEALAGKKFLLVLDDVWNENYTKWESLKRPFEFGARGSKIIVTARNGGVAKMMGAVRTCHLQILSNEDGWNLFERHAFCNIDSDSRPDLVAIGRKIVEKCKGLPLAIKTLGGLLRSEVDVEKWEKILESELWELPERGNDILPALWLSYNYLPRHLKRCFAYSSIFPKDYNFDRETLILLWIAGDFIQPQSNTTVEKTGKEYFDELISRSLFQKLSRYPKLFTMHDLVNDLATFVSGDFSLRLDSDSQVVHSKTRHLSYRRKNISDVEKLEFLSGAEYLRTLLPLGYSWSNKHREWEILSQLLQKLPRLRVLSLSSHSIEKLPNSMGKLRHLRYLDLSRNLMEEIPDAFSSLYNLQTLLLSNCKNLTRLPKNMAKLTKLRHLDIEYTPLKEMPPHMGNMTDLQVLSNFVLGEGSGSNIKELGRLQHLRGKLCISGLEHIGDVGDVSEANLKDKEYLTELTLKWDDQIDAEDSTKEREVLDKLQPHTNLKKLSIPSYRGTSFPNWVASCSFSHMSSLQLSNCKNCLVLPPLGQLLSLKELEISKLDEVEDIGEEFLSTGSSLTSPFRSLEHLKFSDMSKWKRWTFRRGNESEGQAFPQLKKLVLERCPMLVGSFADGIETLEIRSCLSLQFPSGQTFASLDRLEMYDSCHSMTSFELDFFPSLSTLSLNLCPKLTCNLHASLVVLSMNGNSSAEILSRLPERNSNAMEFFPLGHLPKLRGLDLKNFPILKSFTGGVFSCLETLTLELCPKLNVEFDGRFPALRKLNMISCKQQNSFPEEGRVVPNINDIHINECGVLVARLVHLDLKSFTSLESLSIRGYNDELDSYPREGYLPTALTSLWIADFRKLKALNGAAFRQLKCLETLLIMHCPEVTLLPEDDFPTSLRYLSIFSSPLLRQTYNKETGNRWPKISHIPGVYVQPSDP